MKLKINLSSYSLNFLFGDRVFQDSFLLSREVIKKAYQEKLYYISTKENMEEILKGKRTRRMLVFAGIPTFSEVCLELSPKKKMDALKISLSYEDLALFQQDGNDLIKDDVFFEEVEMVTLSLTFKDHKLQYVENFEEEDLSLYQEEILKSFIKELQEYFYEIKKELEYLGQQMTQFMNSEKCLSMIENEQFLQEIKELYEMFIFLKM